MGQNSSPGDDMKKSFLAEGTKESGQILICTTPGVGHLNPVLELSKRIAAQGRTVTLVSSELQISKLWRAEEDSATGQRFGGLDIRLVGLWDGYPINQRPQMSVATIWAIVKNLEDEIERYLERLISTEERGAAADSPPVTCIITDNHLWCTQNVADKLKIPRYVFFTNSAFYVALMWYVPQLVSQGLLQLGPTLTRKAQEKLSMPGFPDLPFDKFPSSSRERPHTFLSCGACLPAARGILINTYLGLEGDGIRALQMEKIQVLQAKSHQKIPRILPVGPLFSSSLVDNMLNHEETALCTQFLDSKPPSSVLYVAFGTEALLSREQIQELAKGLEASEQPFLWALRSSSSAAMDLSALLPPGFRERTSDRGLLLSNFAPQFRVLSHASTAAFLSHCGWNSVMESIHFGVPMICFPQAADQLMNCRFVVDKLKVGIELPRAPAPDGKGPGMASKEETQRAARRMLTGDERLGFRDRVGELRNLARVADVAAHENLGAFLEEFALKEGTYES